jgi:hypothetical protein
VRYIDSPGRIGSMEIGLETHDLVCGVASESVSDCTASEEETGH